MLEVIPAFVGCVEVADSADGLPSGADAAEMSLELGKGQFDGIEIGTIRREDQEPCVALLEDGLSPPDKDHGSDHAEAPTCTLAAWLEEENGVQHVVIGHG